MTDVPTYVLDRIFDAPRELVWRAWTEPELVARWYGPDLDTIVHRLELRPGGLWLVEMRMGGGSSFQRVEYTEVGPPERLAWHQSVTDENWNPTANPMMPDWPRVLLGGVTLEADGARTRMRMTWAPHGASESEIACFAGAIDGMGRGWGAGMDVLAQMLAELQA